MSFQSLMKTGDAQRNNGQGLAAVKTYRQAVELATKAGEWLNAAQAQHMVGVSYKVENDIGQALTELRRATGLYLKAHDPDGPGRVSRDIGICYDYRHDYAEGEVWLKRSIRELKDTTNLPELGISESKLGLHYLHTNQLDDAEHWIGRGLATIRRGSNWFYEMTTLLHRANLYLIKHKSALALQDLNAALNLVQNSAEAQSQDRRLAQIYGLTAHAHLELGDPAKAKADYHQAMQLLEPMAANVAAVIRADIKADELRRRLG